VAASKRGRRDVGTLDRLIATVGADKQRAARARAAPRPRGVEPPREVFRSACAAIAAAFAGEGFSYSPSGPYLKRRDGDFEHRFYFQSSTNNVAGELVELIVHATAFSRRLGAWRAKRKFVGSEPGYVGGGPLGSVGGEREYLVWNLAAPSKRTRAIRDVIDEMRRRALPFFALVKDPERLARALIAGEDGGFRHPTAVEVLTFFCGVDAAARYAAAAMKRNADMLPQVMKWLRTLRATRKPIGEANEYAEFAEQLFFLKVPLTGKLAGR
jgi:hypothetical protein